MLINRTYCFLFFFSYIVVGVLGAFIESTIKVSFLDELIIAVFCGLLFLKIVKQHHISKKLAILLVTWVFFLIYSLLCNVTSNPAIFQGCLQQIKPFLLLFSLLEIKQHLAKKDKKIVYKLTKLLGFVLPVIAFVSRLDADHSAFFVHMANYGNLMMVTSLMFFYCSSKKKNDKILFVIFLFLGIFCLRSKYYGEVVAILFFIFLLKKEIKINLKYFICSGILIFTMLVFSWGKVYTYYQGFNGEILARSALYQTAFELAKDYFPLGSGFGSFADDASKVYYSPIYIKYGLSDIWGLSPFYSNYITDTYFPVVIGQFGVIGLIMLCMFYFFLFKQIPYSPKDRDDFTYVLSLCLLVIFIVESTAGSMFTSYLCIPYMLLLSDIINTNKKNSFSKEL